MQTQNFKAAEQSTRQGFLIFNSARESRVMEIHETLTLGRDRQLELAISDPFVSQRHARIERREDKFFIRDMRSRNGTYVNGTKIIEAYLNHQDVLSLGNTEITFVTHLKSKNLVPFLTTRHEEWQRQVQSLPAIAQSDQPTLILGASGTGKEVVAQTLHNLSKRSQFPMVTINCSAFSESLIESELFGHTKGSFTGATNDRKGAFESARGGTLFLDEIGDMPLALQPKILRAIENKEIRPVGSDRVIKTDVRILAATCQPLASKVVERTFREDLYYRLKVISVEIPSLKERIEDFEELVFRFCKEFRIRFSHNAIAEMKKHKWPGNIRELRNSIARASVLYRGRTVEPEDLNTIIEAAIEPKFLSAKTGTETQNPSVIKELEKQLIIERLMANGGNQRRTALDLGMPKSTLHDRIRSYQIQLKS